VNYSHLSLNSDSRTSDGDHTFKRKINIVNPFILHLRHSHSSCGVRSTTDAYLFRSVCVERTNRFFIFHLFRAYETLSVTMPQKRQSNCWGKYVHQIDI
jgi:hypothetical protein